MPRKASGGRISSRTRQLVEDFARKWGFEAVQGLPPEFKAHMSASVREGLLAMASLWEETLRDVQKKAHQVRRRVEQLPGASARARRPRRRAPRR